MHTTPKNNTTTTITRAATHSSSKIRVRLLVAIPALIVLLLAIMAAIFFWITNAHFPQLAQTHPTAIREFSRDWLYFLAIFIIAGATIGYLLAWSLTRPIQHLIRHSQRIASGDLNTKIPIHRHDEFGELGSSFNHMIDSLQTFIQTRNRYILDSFTGGLIITDNHGTITAVNSAAESLLNLPNETIINQPIQDTLNKPPHNQILELHQQVLWKQKPLLNQQLQATINGTPHHLTLNLNPMKDKADNIIGIIINIRDHHEMQRFYQTLQNTDRLAAMGTFATGLAHEIRNPLGAIKTTAQLLHEDLHQHPNAQQYLNIITKEVNRLDTLVNEVQAYSQPTKQKTPTNITQLIHDTIHLARNHPQNRDKTIQLLTDIPTDLPPINLNPDQIRQALLNILLNAYHATPPDHTIRITATHTPTHPQLPLTLIIANQGPPIPHDLAQRIFQPFFTTKTTGTGLGLSITYQIITNHHGTLTHQSRDGWVTFTVQLPNPPHTPPQNK